MSNYRTKVNLKGVTGINTSEFIKNIEFANFKMLINQKLIIQKLYLLI